MTSEKLMRVYDMNSLSLLHEFLSHFLVAREETTISGEELQGSVRRFITDHEIRH